jgi:hypothetical protein
MGNVLSKERREQVIALGRLGWSLRRIEQATGVRRETAGDYLASAMQSDKRLSGSTYTVLSRMALCLSAVVLGHVCRLPGIRHSYTGNESTPMTGISNAREQLFSPLKTGRPRPEFHQDHIS